MRVLCSAGAALDLTVYDGVKEIFPNAMFFNNYGMTEAAPRIAFCRDDDPRFGEATCGRPMEGVEVKIVDPETHDEMANGARGVLVVRGPNVTSGYLNDAEQTSRAFTKDGYLISGDVAYRDGDYLFICGRLDDMFNCGGEKVVPLEIERVLNRLPGVEMSAWRGSPTNSAAWFRRPSSSSRPPISRAERWCGSWPANCPCRRSRSASSKCVPFQ